MEEALVQLQAKDTKERMAGVERLQTLLEQCRKSLTAAEVSSLVDASISLLKDNNFKVAQGALQALASAAALAGEHLKLHFNALLPATVERLGDSKQPVRDAGRRFLLALMEISSPTTIVERAGAYAWSHKNWRVREEFARTAASALNLFTAAELPFQRLILPSVLHLLEDSNSSVREAAMLCLEEMYRQGGQQFGDELQRHQLRASQLKEINARFEKIEPVRNMLEKQHSSTVQCMTPPNRFSAPPNNQMKSVSQQAVVTNHHWPVSELKVPVSGGSTRGNSPKSKLVSEGDSAMVEKPADPIRVFSEKDLTKEFEKAASMLAPAQDWSIRMSAMQRIEGIVAGGATKYSGFLHLLKQLVNPLCDQLADRRSSIVKQACQLLKVLTKELKQEFEAFAESFLPMLFKLVVITVLVIAESADACIKSMLQHCKVARVLPKMVELAKHDRNAVLRARCCEYLLLVLEQWFDSPEMQRSAELYEDLIKCCCGDAMSEVRSLARQCYRVFARCWPDRARRLYQAFDPVTQRVINDEDGGILKKYGHSTVHDTHLFRSSSALPTPATSTHSTTSSGLLNSSNGLQSTSHTNGYNTNPVSRPSSSILQRKSSEGAPERSLQSVLQASQQQVNAIESMLKGVSVEDQGSYYSNPQATVENSYSKIHSSSGSWPLRGAGVDPPSSRDPPHQASGTAPYQQPNLSAFRPGSAGRTLSGPSAFGDMDAGRLADFTELAGNMNHDFTTRALGKTQSAKRVPMSVQKYTTTRSSNGDYDEPKQAKRIPRLEGQLVTDGINSVPAYQRPLLRQTGSGRVLGSSRSSSIEDSLPTVVMNSSGEVFTYMDGLMSLNDALTEGLSPGSDWSARVAAFTFLKKLLQQGSKGLQEVSQSFERVMRLFSEHLDDPHHKVAQAALSTLVELVPACRKQFESYLERILPHVFARLVDAKEVIRQLSTSALETVGNTYSIDALLPALLRSLDEQRSPKAKMAVIEFAIAAFAKLALNGEASGGSGLLKLWLAKLAPLVHDKNAKLKETAVTGLISVYSHFDSTIVLNFILGLSIEEQSTLRRALKHYTPRIEVDLMIYMQNRSQRNKATKLGHERPSTSSTLEEKEEDYLEQVSPTGERIVAGLGHNMGRKWVAGTTAQPDAMNMAQHQEGAMSSMTTDQSRHSYPPFAYVGDSSVPSHSKTKDSSANVSSSAEITTLWLNETQDQQQSLRLDTRHNELHSEGGNHLDSGLGMVANPGNLQFIASSANAHHKDESSFYHQKTNSKSLSPVSDSSSGVLQLSSWDGGKAVSVKENALEQLMDLSHRNDSSTWSKYYNQVVTVVLEALDDPEATIRELAASVMLQMLKHQKERLDKDTEVLLEKLLQSARDTDPKVGAAADLCLNTVLTELDTYRCLSVVVPLLVSENEKTLVTCISCLTKLVSRLPPEELTSKLNSFLPMLFDAFGNQDADVRKTVVFCLVEIYIVLGKSFVPYLGNLSSTQLRLVTIYANRISQARMGSASQPTQPL